MRKRLIVNADEFGLTEGVNKGIIEAHSEGILSSTTAIMNMWALDDAMTLAVKNPELGVGVHLNITDGKPVLPNERVRSLFDKKGFFYKRSALVRRLLSKQISLREVKDEFLAQIERLESYGVIPTHLDFHQNALFLPGIFGVAMSVAREKRLPLRLTQEGIIFDNIFTRLKYSASLAYLKKLYVFYTCFPARSLLKKNGIKTVDRVYSIVGCFSLGKKDVSRCYEMIIDRLRNGVTELMVHPGYMDDRLIGFVKHGFTQAKLREEEMKVLKSPEIKEMCKNKGIELINYRFFK